jgi:hypothetical protein
VFHFRGAREAAKAQCMRDYGLMAAFAGPLHKDLESETALQAKVENIFWARRNTTVLLAASRLALK